MKTYEITYITINEEAIDAGSVSPALAEAGARIVSVHPWSGRRKLAFPIKKQDQAFYTTVVFEADPSAIRSIEKSLIQHENVLRILIVDFEPGYFHRSPVGGEDTATRPAESVKPAPAVEEKAEEPAQTIEAAETVSEPESETTEETPKKKRASRKTAEAPDPSLDEKLDALLNEDITK